MGTLAKAFTENGMENGMKKIPTDGGKAVVWKMDADGELSFTTAKEVKVGDRVHVRSKFFPVVEVTQDHIICSEAWSNESAVN